MRHICFLSTDDLEDFFVWDDLLIAPFASAGIKVSTVSWHAHDHAWSQYEAVIVRSTWDYQDDALAFAQVLAEIAEQTRLINPLEVLNWNVNKAYLQGLHQQCVPIIPSVFLANLQGIELENYFAHFGTDEIIVKPLVSANSDNTFRLDKGSLHNQAGALQRIFAHTECMVQPFIGSVLAQGEFSLFYFNSIYSHTIKKVPKAGDFRVQEEHGGQLYSVEPTVEQQQIAEQVLGALPMPCLYSRIDLVDNQGQWQLMEVELIEPSLYFNMDETSPQRFVAATLAYLSENKCGSNA